jgi:outer membrane lipoprotein-sorting protein
MTRWFDRFARRLLPLTAVALLGATAAVSAAPAPTVDTIVADYSLPARPTDQGDSNAAPERARHGDEGREALVLRELKRNGKIRFEFTVQGVTGVYVSDGNKGWQVSPFDGDMAPQQLSDEVTREAIDQADVEGPLVDWRSKGHQLELVGTEAVSGRDAYKLKLTLKTGAVRYEYIDVKSHYQVRTDSQRHVRGQEIAIETTFAEHKKAGGVLFPRRIEVVAAGRAQRLRVVVDKVEVNPPLSDARFELRGAQPLE